MYYLYSNFINFIYSLFYSLCEYCALDIALTAADAKIAQTGPCLSACSPVGGSQKHSFTSGCECGVCGTQGPEGPRGGCRQAENRQVQQRQGHPSAGGDGEF